MLVMPGPGEAPSSSNETMDMHPFLELALEGERLCKGGDFHGGVAFFEAAVRQGTDDMRMLSAVYSQLGNAYFYLGDYVKALEFHKKDLAVARAIGDEPGEGKASGNLGNTLKVMGKFDEAVTCCERHLNISRKLQDKVGEGRALYNLGNVYHAKGKRFVCTSHQDPGEFPEEVKSYLQQAVQYYEESLRIMTELGDRSARGRACGNLGNTHYLLGNFYEAIGYHKERLKIAKEFGDKAAERRAHNNLGNAHIFLGEFETAAEHYKKTLALAIELHDKAVEAQACYSLGNTYTLLHDYPTAIEYHLRHLKIAQELHDRIGEGRAYWSLGNAHCAVGNHAQALHYANLHLEVSREIGDHSGEVSAQHSIMDLQKILDSQSPGAYSGNSSSSSSRTRRISMENMDLLKLTPDSKVNKQSVDNQRERNILTPVVEIQQNKSTTAAVKEKKPLSHSFSADAALTKEQRHGGKDRQELESSLDEESFFELLSRFQSKRMDDQRCSLVSLENKENNQLFGNRPSCSYQSSTNQICSSVSSMSESSSHKLHDDLFDLIAGMQSRRLDDQRASLPCLPGLNLSTVANISQRNSNNNNRFNMLQRASVDAASLPDDDFFDMLMRCQASRIEDQRSSMPDVQSEQQGTSYSAQMAGLKNGGQSASTVPDEDFFSLIMRFQAGRIEDQRSSLPGASSGSSEISSRSSFASSSERKNSSKEAQPEVVKAKQKTFLSRTASKS